MAVRDDFAPGEILAAGDLNDTFNDKVRIVGNQTITNGTASNVALTITGPSTQSPPLLRLSTTSGSANTSMLLQGQGGTFISTVRVSADEFGPQNFFVKRRGNLTAGSIVSNNDILGDIVYYAFDGSADQSSALFRASVDGVPGATDTPSRFQFYVSPDGTSTLTERMRINNAGLITGTGTSLGAWTSWTPTITSGTGTFTTVTVTVARYCQIGKIVHLRLLFNITTNGTAGADIRFTLPVTANAAGLSAGIGREGAIVGDAVICQTFSTTQALLVLEDNGYPGGDGRGFTVSLTYEAA